jgi:uncharacterized lipoprotein YajG
VLGEDRESDREDSLKGETQMRKTISILTILAGIMFLTAAAALTRPWVNNEPNGSIVWDEKGKTVLFTNSYVEHLPKPKGEINSPFSANFIESVCIYEIAGHYRFNHDGKIDVTFWKIGSNGAKTQIKVKNTNVYQGNYTVTPESSEWDLAIVDYIADKDAERQEELERLRERERVKKLLGD